MQYPGGGNHRGEKDDLDEQEGVLVELCHNFDLLVFELVVGDGVFVQLFQDFDLLVGEVFVGDGVLFGLLRTMGLASGFVVGWGRFCGGVRFPCRDVRLFASSSGIDGISSVASWSGDEGGFRARHRVDPSVVICRLESKGVKGIRRYSTEK
jgi:hypothetical protein